jgi:hypothetical protein
MSKVIVEAPRLGGGSGKHPRPGGGSKKQRAVVADLEAPLHQGMRRIHKDRKEFNEHLSPLRRFLESRVGKYWPKVYAEICENLRPSSTVQQHVRDHLEDFVAVRTSIKDGVIWIHDGGRVHRLEEGWNRLYVQPVSRCLLRNKHWTRRRSAYEKRMALAAAEIAERRRDLGGGRQLHKLRGCWFEVTLAPIESRRQTFAKPHGHETRLVMGMRRDEVIDAGLSDLGGGELYGRYDVFAVAKRQLSHRELRKRGLQND